MTNHAELDNYRDYLDHYRETFERQCTGLTAEQLASRSAEPSTLSLLGLLRHLARVESFWTRNVLERQPERPKLYPDPELPFTRAVGTQTCVDDAWTSWRDEVAHAREVFD